MCPFGFAHDPSFWEEHKNTRFYWHSLSLSVDRFKSLNRNSDFSVVRFIVRHFWCLGVYSRFVFSTYSHRHTCMWNVIKYWSSYWLIVLVTCEWWVRFDKHDTKDWWAIGDEIEPHHYIRSALTNFPLTNGRVNGSKCICTKHSVDDDLLVNANQLHVCVNICRKVCARQTKPFNRRRRCPKPIFSLTSTTRREKSMPTDESKWNRSEREKCNWHRIEIE